MSNQAKAIVDSEIKKLHSIKIELDKDTDKFLKELDVNEKPKGETFLEKLILFFF